MLARTSPFIISPAVDLTLFFGSTLVVFAVWAASAVFHVPGYTILAAVAVVSNGPHIVSTWTRLYFDRREWQGRPVSTVLIPLGILVATYLVSTRVPEGARILNSLILYWASWHFVAQNWGIVRIYQRKSGEPDESPWRRLERWALLLIVAFCLTTRLYTGPRHLFGVEVYAPPIPLAVVVLLGVALAVTAGALVVGRVLTRNAPYARSGWLRLGFIGCSFIGFFVPFQLITTDDTSAFAAAAAWHGLQYLGMVWLYQRRTWKGGVDPRSPLISWLAQPGLVRVALSMALLWALAGAVYGVIWVLSLVALDFYRWSSIIWVGVTLSHYWTDGVIWKLRSSEVASRVGVVAEPA